MNETQSEQQGQLARDVRAVVDDAEALLRSAANGAGEATAEVRGRLQQSLAAARLRLGSLEQGVRDRTLAASRATDGYVRDHPWQAVGVAAAVGAVVGLALSAMLSRRD
ncbi:DUF883 domain-containing protein [Ramlibacter sp. G-1-2-2]|uniref:DUF883 domain-containing protein n=1 Tax=Ramlibacter agri TaxID=2728837 RepID=A0A848HD19_9BURK|nr:DUF883 family protein [Ramlibacter agri]NML48052.1 DUF883 domain-containing protein [Ramlibacter agri]